MYPERTYLMKHFVLLCLLLSPLVSSAQTQLYFEESQALTRAVPSTPPTTVASATRPLPLTGWTTFRMWVCPETGAGITSGKVRLYLFSTSFQKWGYNSNLDVTLSTSSTNLCQIFGFRIDVPQGYLLPATMNVVVSSGTTVTVRVEPGKL